MSTIPVNTSVIPFSSSLHHVTLRPWAIGLLIVSALLSVPILVVFASVFVPSGEIWRHLTATVLPDYILNSLLLMCGVGFLVLSLGIIPAWLVTMYRFPGSRILEWALLLPLAIPAYIIAYTYTGLLDVAGPLQSWIRDYFQWRYGDYWFPEVRSLGGAIVMLALVFYPYVYLLCRAAFIEQSICALEVARTLRCGPLKAFFKVAIPLARPAIMVGVSIVLMETLADYGTVQYFGVSAFTTGIFRTWFGLGNSAAAAQLSALLMVFILVLVSIENWSRRQARYHHTSSRYRALLMKKLRGRTKILATTACVLPVIFGFLIPAAQLSIWATQTYSEQVDHEFFALIGHTVGLAAGTAFIALLLALFIAYGKRLQANLLTGLAVRVLSMGYAIPGTVIAVGALLPFAWVDNTLSAWMQAHFAINTGLIMSGTVFALIFAYLVRFLPLALNTVDAGLNRIKPSMDEVGRCLGLRSGTILRKVHIPMLHGTLLTAVLLVFVDVLKELPATLILRPFNFNTLAIRTYELANEERLADAACPALAIVLAGIIPVIILSRSISQARPGHDKHP
ncbi:MAG: ABC transporter permease [Gammaproteobacteria bacterium]